MSIDEYLTNKSFVHKTNLEDQIRHAECDVKLYANKIADNTEYGEYLEFRYKAANEMVWRLLDERQRLVLNIETIDESQ